MDLLTSADLDLLANRGHEGTHLSLFAPTHRLGNTVQADRLGWKNLLSDVDATLGARGLRSPDIAELLAPARAFEDDAMTWQYMSDGLAFFIRPGWHRAFRVPVDVPALGTVGDRFLVGPLHPVVTSDSHFLLLAISQRRVRLLEGSRGRVEEIELRDVPTDLRELIDPHEPRSDTMARLSSAPVGGRAGRAVFYGHGAADEHVKNDEVRRFLRRVAEGMHGFLGEQELPMVLVGLDASLSIYRDVNTYRHLTDQMVHANPDQMSAEELHAAAWPIIAEVLGREQDSALQHFAELHGTGRASSDPHNIEAAAREGRVQTLLAAADPSCWQPNSSGPRVVQLGVESSFAMCELYDSVIVDTLSQGGRTYAVPAAELPAAAELAAVFRY